MLSVLIIVFLLCMLFGMPIAFAMAVSAALTFIVTPGMNGLDIGLKMYSSMDSFSLMAIPFFMFAGELMNDTGITEKIIRFARSLVGSIRGGLGHATVITGVILAGVSGSADADTAAISSLMVPALEKEGYDRGFSCALTAACGNLGPIIPPRNSDATAKKIAIGIVTLLESPSSPSVKLTPFTVPRTTKYKSGTASHPIFTILPVKGIKISREMSENQII